MRAGHPSDRRRRAIFFFALALSFSTPGPAAVNASTADLAAEVRQRIHERVPDAVDDISVERSGERVVLSGTVEHLSQRSLAQEAAEGVPGVQEVENRIRVSGPRVDDARLREDVFWTLKSEPATMALDLDVQVRSGTVTLRGVVDTVPQKRIAEWVASDRIGVREVVNAIRVAPQRRSDREIHDELLAHYAADPLFNDDEIAVEVRNGIVGLSGHVDTAREKNWAREEAWIPGVRQVNADGLGVKYEPTLSHARPARAPDDTEIRQTILRAYVNDPRVASVNPEVGVEDGVVRLDGTVANLRAKRTAVRIAWNTGGVKEVVDRLQVQRGAARTDAEIEGAIRAALRTSAALARNELDVDVSQGRAVLTGGVDSPYEQWLAGDLAERVGGVVELQNRTHVSGAIGQERAPRYFPRVGAATPWTPGTSRLPPSEP